MAHRAKHLKANWVPERLEKAKIKAIKDNAHKAESAKRAIERQEALAPTYPDEAVNYGAS